MIFILQALAKLFLAKAKTTVTTFYPRPSGRGN
jgi:hypothetical protein